MSTLNTIAQLKGYFNTGDFPSEAQFAEFINKAAVYGGEAIFTTANKFYDLTGLTAEQRGTALKLAISEFSPNSFIFLPPGDYYSADGFHWKGRDGGIIGMGISSKATHLYSDADHCLKMDTSYQLYNCGHRNFAVSTTTTGSDFDAVHIAPIDGVGIVQANIELDIHLAQADRDGCHIDADLTTGRFRFKTTGQTVSTGVDRYMVYVNKASGINIQIDDNQQSVFYLDTDSSEVAITLTTTIGAGSSTGTNAKLVDLGTNNAFLCPSAVNAFVRNPIIENFRIVSPTLKLQNAKVSALFPMDRFNNGIAPDISSYQNDGVITGTMALENTSLGSLAYFNGTDTKVTIPPSTSLQNINDKCIFSFLFRTDQVAASKRLFYEAGNIDVKLDSAVPRLEVSLKIGGTLRKRLTTALEVDKFYLVTYTYDGARTEIRLNGKYLEGSVVSGTVDIGTGSLVIGEAFSSFFEGIIGTSVFLNDYSTELVETLEAQMLLGLADIPTVMDRINANTLHSDLTFSDELTGVILNDRNTASKYRLKVESGVLGIEAV